MGTGGPFGAEGPIIATGGALGSLIGQSMSTTATERKTLLAAGAAAGMAATFGAPVSAVLLAVELLLFEFRPRSLLPVALATATATGVRIAFVGAAPAFAIPNLAQPSGEALACYVRIAALVGMAAIFAGASRALLASVVFAFETTRQPLGLLPILGGCTTSFLASSLLLRNSIMTEKIVRRGTRVPSEYAADYLDMV